MAEQHSSLMRRSIRRGLAASGLTAAALYTWWQTIEGARTVTVLPEAQVGAPLALGRVKLTPQSLQLRSVTARSGEEEQVLVLSAEVENVTGETQAAPFGHPPRLIRAQAGEVDFGTPELMLLRDREPMPELQPRMPETMEIVWSAPQGWQPQDVTLTFLRQQFKLKDNLYGRSNWLGYSDAAQMTVRPELAP